MRARTLGVALGAKAAVIGGLFALNRALEQDDLPPTLPGRTHDWPWRLGRVRYTTLGDGPPLVLLHGVNAAASSFEMRKVFEPLAERFTVYAPDLLGFGKSDRPPIEYLGETYVDLVTDFLAEIVGRRCAVVASSLSGSYAVAAAVRRPDLVERLVLTCPAGDTRAVPTNPVAESAYWFLRLPVQGRAAFNALVSRPSLRYFLRRQVFSDRAFATDQLVDQNWATAHQPNARYAPAAFVSGRLNYPLKPYFARLQQPTLLMWGADARVTPVSEGEALRALNPRARLEVLRDCRLLPHDEKADSFLEIAVPFLTAVGGADTEHLSPATASP